MPKIKKAITPRLAAVANAAATSVPMSTAQAKAALEPPVPVKPTTTAPVVPNGRAGKVKRSARVQWSTGPMSVVSIWQEDRPDSGTGTEQDYLCEKLGQGFWLLEKLDPAGRTRYVVFLGESCSCNCKGFLGHGHCKHVAGLDALLSRGKLS